MKKNLFILIIATFLLVGCTFYTKKSITYNVETGDSIKVELKTNGGYNLKNDKKNELHPAAVKFLKNKEKIATGYFDYASEYDDIEEAIESGLYDDELKKVKKIKDTDNDTICYKLISDGRSYCRIKVKGSKTMFTIYNEDYDDLLDLLDRINVEKK